MGRWGDREMGRWGDGQNFDEEDDYKFAIILAIKD